MSLRTACPGVAIRGFWAALVVVLCFSGCSSSSFHSPTTGASASSPTAAIAGYVWDSRVKGLRPALSGHPGSGPPGEPRSREPRFNPRHPCPAHGLATRGRYWRRVFHCPAVGTADQAWRCCVSPDQQMTLSPSCANGLVYSPSHGSGLLITGLASSPRVQSIALRSSGPVSSAVISDSGAILLAAPNAKGTASLEILSATGSAQALSFSVQKIGGIAFLPGVDSAIIADSAANTVYLGKQLSSGPSFAAIAASAQGVSNPRAVATSADGHYAFVANGSGNNLLRIDLTSTGAPIAIALRMLHRLN